MCTKFQSGNIKDRDHLEYRGIDGRTMLNCILRRGSEGADWFHMAQNRYH
jgi:hypothetical protein